MKESTIIQRGSLIVTPAVTEVLLAKAYFRMLEEETLDVVFFQKRPTLLEFLTEYMTHGKRITLGCFRDLGPDIEPEFCGMGWAFDAVGMGKFTKAECGMVFFKHQSSKKDNVAFGRMMLEMFFTKQSIDVIFGTTPEPNKLAIRYAQKIGMSIHGPIPDLCTWNDELTAGWISHISKADWMERN